MAERKVCSLMKSGAAIRLVSPRITRQLTALVQAGAIEYIADYYREDQLEGCFLVISATGDRIVNTKVADDCIKKGLLVNAVDEPGLGNFYVPAVVQRGPLQIAVSTGGQSPMLARKIKEHLEKIFPCGYGSLVSFIGDLRQKIIKETTDPEKKSRVLSSMLDNATMDLINEGKLDQAKERIKNAHLGGGSEP